MAKIYYRMIKTGRMTVTRFPPAGEQPCRLFSTQTNK